jgi:hypothetical protein
MVLYTSENAMASEVSDPIVMLTESLRNKYKEQTMQYMPCWKAPAADFLSLDGNCSVLNEQMTDKPVITRTGRLQAKKVT